MWSNCDLNPNHDWDLPTTDWHCWLDDRKGNWPVKNLRHLSPKAFFWNTTTAHHNRFTALFPGPPGWAGARRELLDFMVQGEINRGRHNDHPAGRQSIWTNQCPPPLYPIFFYGPDALPAAEPTVSKHWRPVEQMEE